MFAGALSEFSEECLLHLILRDRVLIRLYDTADILLVYPPNLDGLRT